MKNATEVAVNYAWNAKTFLELVRRYDPGPMSTPRWILHRLLSVLHPRRERGIEELQRRNLSEAVRLVEFIQSLLDEHKKEDLWEKMKRYVPLAPIQQESEHVEPHKDGDT